MSDGYWQPADIGVDPSGYADGQVPVFDDGTGQFVPGNGGTVRQVVLVDDGAGGLEPLTDDDGLWLYGAYPGLAY